MDLSEVDTLFVFLYNIPYFKDGSIKVHFPECDANRKVFQMADAFESVLYCVCDSKDNCVARLKHYHHLIPRIASRDKITHREKIFMPRKKSCIEKIFMYRGKVMHHELIFMHHEKVMHRELIFMHR